MGRKVGRNAPCPCGSGLKFKNCCLERAKGLRPPPLNPGQLPGDPWVRALSRAADRAGAPQGTLVPSVEHKGYRFRAVGHRLYWRPPQETFHEFLINLLKRTLGAAWHREQIGLPPEQRHQIHRWYKALADHTRSVVGNERYREGRVYGAAPTGDVRALIALAYDLCHLLHNGGLPRKVLERLKSREGFQGARYEIAVAATFVRAGCKVGFIEEKTQKHCEFIAQDPRSGAEIAVEAKSRHREGVLHQPGEIDEFRLFRGDVEHLVSQALEKDPGDRPFMIFVDLNVPLIPGIPVQERAWFRDVWEFMQSLGAPTADRPDEFTAIVLTNFSYHFDGARPAGGGEHLCVVSKYPRHQLPEELLGRIMAAVAAYGQIPAKV